MIRQLVNWVRRDKLEAACDRELRYHLESRMSDLQASGMPAEEARRQTVLELGGIAHLQEEGSARRLADSLDPRFRL